MNLLGRLAGIVTREQASLRYECQACGEQFSVQHYCCPSCDGYSIERVSWQTITD
jgi:lipopolysaccharide biosynthesis regulator YciM